MFWKRANGVIDLSFVDFIGLPMYCLVEKVANTPTVKKQPRRDKAKRRQFFFERLIKYFGWPYPVLFNASALT